MRTAAEKIAAKANKYDKGYDIAKIDDLLRSRIIAKDASDKVTVLNELKNKANVTNVSDHTAESNPWGYSGTNVAIKNEFGHLK